jgi:transposase-like protein
MVSNSKTKLGEMNDRNERGLARGDYPGHQTQNPPQVHSRGKDRIVLEGLRGEASINDLCRKEGIHPTMYYKWSKAFLEAGKRQLNGDTIREAGSDEVKELRIENNSLKMVVAELTLHNRRLKKTSDDMESGSTNT